MSKHLLGSDRILHEGAGYRNKRGQMRYLFQLQLSG